jgi:sugar phosphate isomerase/epimerase
MAMDIGLIHYNLPGTLTEFLDYAAETGFRCLEVQSSDVWANGESIDEAKRRAENVKAMLDARNLYASGLAAGNDFFVTDDAGMNAQVERMKTICDLAEIIGTKILRVDGGWAKPGVPEEKYLDLMVEGFKRTVGFAEAKGQIMALDNHGTSTNDADLQIKIFDLVGSDCMGANVDTMNYRWFGHDLETIRGFYKKIAPYVRHTHFKDGRGSRNAYVGTALGEGEIELEYAIKCLKDVGYQGPWLVEYEGSTYSREGYRKGLEYLRARL